MKRPFFSSAIICASDGSLALYPVGESMVELISGTTPDSKHAKMIAEGKGGLNHICFEVEDIDEALAELKAKGIPLLDQIPGVGDAFSHQTFTRARTELILFIRPTVIKDAVDASVIAEEMRSKMNSRLVGTSDRVIAVDPKTGAAGSVVDLFADGDIQVLGPAAGAKGIVVGGMCCSGEELLARHGTDGAYYGHASVGLLHADSSRIREIRVDISIFMVNSSCNGINRQDTFLRCRRRRFEQTFIYDETLLFKEK